MTANPYVSPRLALAIARADAVLQRVTVGESKRAIAKELGVSRQRVQQICNVARMRRDMQTGGPTDA